ncbi:MAG: lactate utilization protein LutB domain-containing protein [Planctomycetia bacterium]
MAPAPYGAGHWHKLGKTPDAPLHNRRNAARTAPNRWEKLGHRLFVAVASRPWLFATGGAVFRRTLGLVKALRPPLVRDWLASRDLPQAPPSSFRDQWSRR